MKKCLFVVFLAVLALFMLNMPELSAQVVDKEIVVKESDLTPGQLEKIKQRKVYDKIEEIGKYAGMGKEIGTGVREGLIAIKDVSTDLADTGLGKFTMFLIAYKIIGKDIIQFVVGFVFLAVFLSFFIWSYRKNCVPRSILIREDKDGGKDYKDYTPEEEDKGVHWVALAIFFIMECIIFFA